MLLFALALLQASPPVRPVTLTTPERVLEEEFSQIRGVHYTKRFIQNSSTSGRDGGGLSANPPMTDAEIQVIADNNDWAERRPPFTDQAPLVGSDGTLWVERSVPLDAPQVWDLFDARGHRTAQVTLLQGRRLAGLGAGKVYLVATDDDGMERVERYRFGS